jgi:hypothetical protein
MGSLQCKIDVIDGLDDAGARFEIKAQISNAK